MSHSLHAEHSRFGLRQGLRHAFRRTSFVQAALASLAVTSSAQVTPHAGMLRYPDVSADSIVFVYADDLWLVPRGGGVATPLASPPGGELFPRFSPDGRTIAFVGDYDAGRDIYTVAIDGGVPVRVTHHPSVEVLCDWTPDGKLLFFTNGVAGRDRQTQMFIVSPQGGAWEKLPIPYGSFGSISPSGEWLAYTPHTADMRTWKRYRGGMATDIWLFNLKNNQAKRATEWEGTDTQPMWSRDQLVYLSDEGPSHRLNLWTYDPASGKRRQLTRYADYDVKWPAIGPGPKGGKGEIVFQHGPDLMLFDLETEQAAAVSVRIPGARPKLRPQGVDAAKLITSWDISPSGKRALVSAHGDVWTLPAKDGTPRNLTRTSGAFERDPAWSPDGKSIAWFSDASGEYELYIAPADGKSAAKRVTRDGHMFRARPQWSPNSKYVAFTDKTGSLFLQPVEGGAAMLVDRDPWIGDLRSEEPSWSHDSRWLAFTRLDETSRTSTIWLYEVETGGKHQVTSGMFGDSRPVFDRKGDWLYFESNRSFAPTYGDFDTTWIYTDSTLILGVPLRTDVVSPFLPKSDEETGKRDDGDDKKADGDKQGDKKDDKRDEKKEEKKDDKKPRERVDIAFDGFERRAIQLPIEHGRFGALAVNDQGALVYVRLGHTTTDEDEAKGGVKIFDPADKSDEKSKDKPKEKTVVDDASSFVISADGKKLLVPKDDGAVIVDAREAPKDSKPEKVVTDGMRVEIEPREEWRQLFDDAWRIMRDWFYDPKMHNVNWAKVRDDYAPMLADCSSRDDVSYVLREMISELNVGHAYYDEGPTRSGRDANVGMLGCDFALDAGQWRIVKIHEGAAWDVDARNPLTQAGVVAGEWLLAVNGAPLDAKKDPWTGFDGLAGRAITLTIGKKPAQDGDARDVVVKALANERDLRYRGWIEKNRTYVDKKTNGKVGYVYVPSTGVDGQNDLVRQFFGQTGKAALIIDERWNSGGQIPTRFIELLNRPVTNYWARRDAKDWVWPPDAHSGPKCMLINGLSGSGGDAFPAYFKMMGLGPLIGTRTWGGLVGLSGNPRLIDGSSITVPTFGYFEKDGTWGIEGHGVDPDVLVVDDPALMVDGGDPQLDKAIEMMLIEIEKHPYVQPARPAYPDRSGMGIADSDK